MPKTPHDNLFALSTEEEKERLNRLPYSHLDGDPHGRPVEYQQHPLDVPTPVDLPADQARFKQLSARLAQSVIDYDAHRVGGYAYENERALARVCYNLGDDAMASITPDTALEYALTAPTNSGEANFLRLSECLERRSGYTYRLF
jgi:hypothetical protein